MTPQKESTSWAPHSYQMDAMKLMVSQACAGLFLDPGLGKTSISLGAYSVLKAQGFVKRCLIIAPLRVCYNVWPKEIRKWKDFENLSIHILHNKGLEKVKQADIYVINPEGLDWLVANNMIARLGIDMLIVDESTKFKNSQTQRFKLLKKELRKFKRRYILTGTPAPNGLMDLFGQIYILDEGNALGRYITHYRNTYFYPGGFGGYEWFPQADAMDRITARLAPLTLRLKAKDYLDLPEIIPDDIIIQLPDKARKVYNDMETHLITQIDAGEVISANAAVASSKCRQICNGALYTHLEKQGDFEIIHKQKIDALGDLIEQLSGQPLFILYEFDFERQMMFDNLKIPYFGVSAKRDSELNDAFNAGRLHAVAGQPGSVAWGLNLQESCAHICWFGMTWNLEHYDQAIGRIVRQGNPNKRVFLHHIIAEDTIDEVVIKVLKGKDKTQQAFLDGLKRLRS